MMHQNEGEFPVSVGEGEEGKWINGETGEAKGEMGKWGNGKKEDNGKRVEPFLPFRLFAISPFPLL
jgi:hypothetical protein